MTVIAIPFTRVQSLYRQRNPMGHWFEPATMGRHSEGDALLATIAAGGGA